MSRAPRSATVTTGPDTELAVLDRLWDDVTVLSAEAANVGERRAGDG